MKSFLFVFALVFSQVSSADIKIMSFEGIHGIHFNGSGYSIALDGKASGSDFFKVSFQSSDKIGTPRITTVDVTEYAIPVLATVTPLVAVNQVTTLSSTAQLMSIGTGETRIYRIGVDGNNDGMLNSPDDDYITISLSMSL